MQKLLKIKGKILIQMAFRDRIIKTSRLNLRMFNIRRIILALGDLDVDIES